jgi:prepilin-type N-terminal cleavage/methylation domain-containing protein/prepilin-type processing-associated H-X9-DG protein
MEISIKHGQQPNGQQSTARVAKCQRASRSHKRRGFTLIELLIVISIIALLAAILFPAFRGARESARRASCASNLKQVGLGIMQYSQDYDERLPGAVSNAAGSGQLGGWAYYTSYDTSTYTANFDMGKGSIYPYVKSTQIFVCPSDTAGRLSGNSYALNSCTMTADAGPGKDAVSFAAGKSLAAFSSTSNMLYGAEEVLRWTLKQEAMWKTSTDDGYLQYGAGGDGSEFADNGNSAAYNNPISSRHVTGINQGLLASEGGSNILFLDGHVKFTRISAVDSQKLRTGGTGVCD